MGKSVKEKEGGVREERKKSWVPFHTSLWRKRNGRKKSKVKKKEKKRKRKPTDTKVKNLLGGEKGRNKQT